MNNLTNIAKFNCLTTKEQTALREYQEYKKLRTIVTRPIRAFNDTEAILKDLQGKDFSSLEREIERTKKSRTKINTTPKLT